MKKVCSASGEVGRMYEADVDDIGCRLVAVYTPVREDGVGGVPISASTDPIAIGWFSKPFLFRAAMNFL